MSSRPLDLLRALLDHLDGEQRSDQLAFFQGILEAGPDAVGELGSRLPGSRAPKALRRLAMEASFYFPWPEWIPIHERMLRYEPDHEIFVTGARALGRIGTAEALEALRELNAMRQGAEFKETLAEVLSEADPREAFNHYLERLLQGSANAAAANEAAQRLAPLVDADSIPALRTVSQHPDLLVFRHALALLARIRTSEAASALLEILADSHREALADRRLKEALGAVRGAAPGAGGSAAAEALEALEAQGAGAAEAAAGFLREALAAAQDGKGGQLPALLARTAEGLHQRGRRLAYAVDAAAEGLAEMVDRGLADAGAVLDLLVPCYREQTGREGLARALARLASSRDTGTQDLILRGPDGAQRAAAVEVLGARGDPELAPFLLQACRDPLTDIADRARFHLGRLPDAEGLALGLLRSPAPADFQLGLELVSEQRFRALVPELLAMLKGAAREDLVLHLVQTLGAVAAIETAQPLLDMLHSGQSPRLQLAVAQALGGLRTPETALALCAKADDIKLPALHVVAVEALAGAYQEPWGPMPPEAGPALAEQVRRAWNDRSPWAARLQVVQALQGVDLDAPAVWQDLAGLVNGALGEKRSPTAWTPDELRQVQAAAREFARRGSAQG
jgi:hypothetical protein